MKLPKYNLLYFKCLLDVAFIEFFQEHNDQFAKEGDKYFFCGSMSKQAIENFFEKSILRQLKLIVKPFDIINAPNYYFIIGACQPKDNFLLNFRDSTFPKKLSKAIEGKIQLKYLLKEKDIVVDMVQFNEACCEVFNKMFSGENAMKKHSHVVFLTHKRLDCYSMFKILKCMLGRANCVNLRDALYSNVSSPIVAVNDLIDKSVHNKIAANRDARFKKMFEEVKQFVDMKIQR